MLSPPKADVVHPEKLYLRRSTWRAGSLPPLGGPFLALSSLDTDAQVRRLLLFSLAPAWGPGVWETERSSRIPWNRRPRDQLVLAHIHTSESQAPPCGSLSPSKLPKSRLLLTLLQAASRLNIQNITELHLDGFHRLCLLSLTPDSHL